MKNKVFKKLKKGDTLWVFSNYYGEDKTLYECPITKFKREKPATLPAYSTKWIIDTNAEPFRMEINLVDDKIYIMKEDFEKSVLTRLSDWDTFEFIIIGTSKEVIREKLCTLMDARKKAIDSAFTEILKKFENE